MPLPELHRHRADNEPACLRQPVRKGLGRSSVHDPLHAGCLLFGASFFSYRNLELRFCNANHFIVELRLDFYLPKLHLQFSHSLLECFHVLALILRRI